MSRLDLGNLADPEESAWFCLNEGPLDPGLLGTHYDPTAGPGETRTETLRVGLRGSLLQLRAVIRKLANIVELVRLRNEHGIGHAVYLRAFPAESASPVVSRLLRAELRTPPGSLAYEEGGAMAVDLVITRLNCFDGVEQPLILNNGSGSGYNLGLLNLDDNLAPGNDNFFYVNTNALESDLPAPIRLQISNNSSAALGQLFVGAFHERVSTEKPALVLEGEAASEAVLVSASGASGGAFGRFSVPGNAWQSVASWDFNYARLALLGGRLVLPVLRFQTPPGVEAARFRMLLRPADASPGQAAFQTPASAAQSGARFLTLAPFRLPFGGLSPRYAPAALKACLQVFIPTAGTHMLDIDDLLLLPQDNFAWFNAGGGLGSGARLMDDSFARESYMLIDGQQLRGHERVGTWLELPAGARSWFFCFQVNVNGIALPQSSLGVRAWFRTRRLIL